MTIVFRDLVQTHLLPTREAVVIVQDITSQPLGILPDVSYEKYLLQVDDRVLNMIIRFPCIEAADRIQAIVNRVSRWKREHSGYMLDDINMTVIPWFEAD